jgi:hypothetical protein
LLSLSFSPVPAAGFTSSDKDFLCRHVSSAFGVNEVVMKHFPEYRALQARLKPGGRVPDDLFNEQELRDIKFWLYLAHFDPDFLGGGR